MTKTPRCEQVRFARFGAPVFDHAHGAREIGAIVNALLGGAEPLEAHSRFGGLLRRHAVVPPLRSVPRAVRLAREYVEAHRTESLSLSALAARVGLHPLHRTRAFRRAIGLPPHAYVIPQRVQLATRRITADESLGKTPTRRDSPI